MSRFACLTECFTHARQTARERESSTNARVFTFSVVFVVYFPNLPNNQLRGENMCEEAKNAPLKSVVQLRQEIYL